MVKSSVVKILDSTIKRLVLRDQTLNPCNVYMSGEPTPKTSTTLSLPEDNSQSGMGMSKTLTTFSCTRQHANYGPNLSGMIMQSPIFKMKLETVYVYVKPCTVMAPPGNLCSQECNQTWVLSFTQDDQPSLGKKCFPWNNILVVLDDLMRETVDSDKSLCDCGDTKPVCLRQAQHWNEWHLSIHSPFQKPRWQPLH